MQFLITAYDGADMLEKRMSVRGKHLENMGKVDGKVICAGGLSEIRALYYGAGVGKCKRRANERCDLRR